VAFFCREEKSMSGCIIKFNIVTTTVVKECEFALVNMRLAKAQEFRLSLISKFNFETVPTVGVAYLFINLFRQYLGVSDEVGSVIT